MVAYSKEAAERGAKYVKDRRDGSPATRRRNLAQRVLDSVTTGGYAKPTAGSGNGSGLSALARSAVASTNSDPGKSGRKLRRKPGQR